MVPCARTLGVWSEEPCGDRVGDGLCPDPVGQIASTIAAPPLAARTAGLPGPLSWLFPQQSVGDAWMDTGTIDVQSGCSAVALAVGINRNDAIDRRENERQ